MLIDSHAHLQFPELKSDIKAVFERARANGVEKIICIGTTAADSAEAVSLSQQYDWCWASVGLHPHDAKHSRIEALKLAGLIDQPRVIAVGECGLDYHYQHSSKLEQARSLAAQIELALRHSKPLIFHVREAFSDFFKVIDKYPELSGVVHSFSSTPQDLDNILARGFYVGLNGIMTFTKDESQLAAGRAVPLEKLLLETDAPFLTPAPNRGKVNEPKYIAAIAHFLADLRGESPEQIAQATTQNATKLFNITS